MKGTLPAGENARRHWRQMNYYNRADADAFAAAVWRYAETGEAVEKPACVDEEDWAEVQAETERIKATRFAAQKGGAAGRGVSRNAGNRNASKSIAESIAESIPTRAQGNENENEEKKKIQPEDEREKRRSSDSGFSLKGSDSDTMRARMLEGEREAVEVALEWAGETGNALSRNSFAKACRRLGVKAFAEAVCSADAEARADGEPRKRGAALNARLKRLAETPTPTPKANPAPKPSKVEEAASAPVAPPRSQVAHFLFSFNPAPQH